ncbi:MAG: SDR family NAD(P)-dependent oxidoreductase, partial [Blastochloris sp.]|nr:SDR family NAD(P)-dependent oxidoreductase [Blastochloris sp.]
MARGLSGTYALVTGASSGLGSEFARQLAAHGCNLILVARREARLHTLREELAGAHPGCDIIIMPLDLTLDDAPQRLYESIVQQGKTVGVLVNNAGLGVWGSFAETPWPRIEQMIALDIRSLVHLTKLFVDAMLARDAGYILHVASVAAYQPTPTYACYAAAKSFVLHFGEALSYELRQSNVS